MMLVGRLSEVELSALSMFKAKQELWLELKQDGIFFRAVSSGRCLKESKLTLGKDSGFSFTTLKAKLLNRVFINVESNYLMDQLL